MGIVIFNGVRSSDVGIFIEHGPTYSIPERDYETVHVPGRNGDIFIDKGCYKNGKQSYEIAVGDLDGDFTKMANAISRWLHPKAGYCRLEDSYSPDYYRMASYYEALDIENVLFKAGRATVTFDCKPQRFLKSGERTITFTKSGKIKNPTLEASKPLIVIKGSASGSGAFQIGTFTGSISNIRSTITLDCELQDAYQGLVNRNSDVSLGPGGFPKLVPGDSNISFSGGITSMEVIPRWWTV